MQHFWLEGEHLVPFEDRDPALIAAHRAFLQQGYQRGDFLLSGPTIPPRGGILIARAASRDALARMLADEPYTGAHVMRFKHVNQFDPVQCQPILADWFGRKS